MWHCAALALVMAAPVEEPALEALVREALEARPELAQAAAQVQAARERVPQAAAMPEPMLQVAVQNDGFTAWRVGVMGTSWVGFMASQTFPFPGKLGLRGELAEADVRASLLAADRVRLSTIAEVRRSALALQVVRERRALADKLLGLDARLVEVARLRLASGGGSQAEVLRAQVEVTRVAQRRLSLEAEERVQVNALNRLRRRPLDTPIPPLAQLDTLPGLLAEADALTLAKARSPELLAAKTSRTRAGAAAALGQRSYLPDVSVSASLMLRGALEPMWALSVGAPLPLFAGARQSRAVAEAEAQALAADRSAEAIEQLLELRARQREATMAALSAVWASTRERLLPQADAAAESTATLYATGRATFADVLDANAVSISEADAALQVVANAWRLVIAQDELSLNEPTTSTPVNSVTSASPSTGM